MHGWLLAKVSDRRPDGFTISPPNTHGNSGTIEPAAKYFHGLFDGDQGPKMHLTDLFCVAGEQSFRFIGLVRKAQATPDMARGDFA
jgi:hypothetical protein